MRTRLLLPLLFTNLLLPLLFTHLLLIPAAARVPAQSSVGEVSFPNSGAAAAQADFLNGLALLHNFEYDDAARAFRKAQEKDPDFALAYWGEAMTHNHTLWEEQDLAAARGVLCRLASTPAARIAKAKTEREKDYLRAVDILFGEGAKHERDVRYADFMASLHEKYPGDPETTCFCALALLGSPENGRDIPTYMRAAALLEDIFYAHPNHPGAAHYLIHSFDDPVHAPLGLPAARAYSRIAPDAAHAQHMTSHIFFALGMWDDVVRANERAIAVVNRKRTAAGKPPQVCGHYNIWLQYACLQQGRFVDARRLLSACREQATKTDSSLHAHGAVDLDTTSAGSVAQMRAQYLIVSKDWKGEVAGWDPGTGTPSFASLQNAYAAAIAAARRNDANAARNSLQELEAVAAGLGPVFDAEGYSAAHPMRAVPGIEAAQVRALLLAQDGKNPEAAALLEGISKEEFSLPYAFGPPDIALPSPELLGELYLAMDRPAEARKAFETSLARQPLRLPSLQGLARAARLAGDRAAAERTEATLRRILRHADKQEK